MATKRKGTIQRIVDGIGNLMRQPMSDESNEVPTTKDVRRSEKVAAGKKRSTTKKAKTASRKKKR